MSAAALLGLGAGRVLHSLPGRDSERKDKRVKDSHGNLLMWTHTCVRKKIFLPIV